MTTLTIPSAGMRAAPTVSQRRVPPTMRGPVMVAVDTVPGATTLIAGRQIAHHIDVAVEAISVLEPLPMIPGSDNVLMLTPPYDAFRSIEHDRMVRRRLEQAWGDHVEWQLTVLEGDVARVIAEEARRRHASLIVMGKGQHARVDRVLGGEVALRVAMLSPVPMLAVAHDFDHIVSSAVVGVDFSVSSFVAARTTLALITGDRRNRGKLTLVHARPLAPIGMNDWATRYDAAVEPRFRHFVRMLAPYAGSDIDVETRIVDGSAVDRLLDLAAETHSNLVAVGTRGRTWWQRLFVGSTATSLLRKSGATVLIAPPPNALERVRLELMLEGRSSIDQPDDWDAALHAFSQRNRFRRARLEVVEDASSTNLEVENYQLTGATFDRASGRISLMMGDAEVPTQHLSHVIDDVINIDIIAANDGRDSTLLVQTLRGHAVLSFTD